MFTNFRTYSSSHFWNFYDALWLKNVRMSTWFLSNCPGSNWPSFALLKKKNPFDFHLTSVYFFLTLKFFDTCFIEPLCSHDVFSFLFNLKIVFHWIFDFLCRTGFKKSPKISGKDIDLYLLYVLVTAHGGWMKVSFITSMPSAFPFLYFS